ncbi:hypothetical protein A3K86_00620 [Photobacterium jeanii]|uniref:3',5'-cyclic-nucleotide phosphodiesterase n=1 Tax=Photobacterium jeanii TaxID=858640 RepID=A0A178KRL2_9GAMM|nr:DUF484 family protein [Photobacterium jeanii]OAN19172.1 hypothetical protein A3K86_00620 [Photobacterium jeanii]PST87180.1 DUF484 domain-containing protein [Photobacterium jeanii]
MTDVSQLDELDIETPATPLSDELNDDTVAEYLLSHPDFFLRQPDLLAYLQVPQSERGVVSLVEIQLERLRHRVGELEGNITRLVDIAAKNSDLHALFSQAQVKLFQTHNIYQALLVLDELTEALNLDYSLRLFDSLDEQLFLERREFDSFRASHLVRRNVYLGRLRKKESEMLFDAPPHLGSFLVMPLGFERPIGVLSFVSADGGHFQPNMDTLFVEQLALIIARLISHWEYTREVID